MKNFDIIFCVDFELQCQNFISVVEPGDYSCSKGLFIPHFWYFPNIFLFPEILSIMTFGKSCGNSHIKFLQLSNR